MKGHNIYFKLCVSLRTLLNVTIIISWCEWGSSKLVHSFFDKIRVILMDYPFTEQCFYSNCLCCQTNITIINLHTFVLDKVRVRELCCPLISRKLMIKSHACIVQENTHTQEGFTGLIPLPSPPLWKFKIRCIELTFALTFKLSQTRERVFIRYPNTLKMIQQN